MPNIESNGSQFTSNKPYLFRALYEWILDNDATPYLLVDATQINVQVPREHVKNGQIVLNASPSAIQGWLVDNSAISFSARFSGKAQYIYIPMKSLLAVYAQENGLGMAFPPEDADELTASIGEEKPDSSPTKTRQKKSTSHLKVIK